MSVKLSQLKELCAYGIGGVSTTLFNIFVFQALLFLQVDYKISNLVAIILTKILAYFVNKVFVFKSKCSSIGELLKEICRYIITRGATGLIDYFGLIFAVDILGFHAVYSKYFLQVVVILSNYILGRKAVFKNKSS